MLVAHIQTYERLKKSRFFVQTLISCVPVFEVCELLEVLVVTLGQSYPSKVGPNSVTLLRGGGAKA